MLSIKNQKANFKAKQQNIKRKERSQIEAVIINLH